MTITPIHIDDFSWYDYKRYSFSLGLQTAGGIYLSGHTASEYEPETRRMIVRGGMAEQVRTVYAKVAAILAGAGLGLGDVVRIVEYVRPEGIERHGEAAAVRAELFGPHAPVVNTVPVKSLLRPDALIEIEVTAAAAPAAPSAAVYLPSIQPLDERGQIVGSGDVAAQLHAIHDRAERMLAEMGLGLDRVVKSATYIAPSGLPGYGQAARVRQARLGPVMPAGLEIVMPRLLHPDALVQCDFIASRDEPVAVDPGQGSGMESGYSPAVRTGRRLYISAQGAIDRESGGSLHAGDVVAQTEHAYGKVLALIEAAGGGPQHLVKTVEYVTSASLGRYRETAGLRSRMFRQPLPASTGLISESLSHPELLIAVDALAVLD